jgi:hypothetical protein
VYSLKEPVQKTFKENEYITISFDWKIEGTIRVNNTGADEGEGILRIECGRSDPWYWGKLISYSGDGVDKMGYNPIIKVTPDIREGRCTATI